MASPATADPEVEILEDLILRGWRYLTFLQVSLARESRELDGFLDHYYRQLEGWLQQAAEPGNSVRAGEGGGTSFSQACLHARQKKLYREILKLCHPDVAQAGLHALLLPAMEAYMTGDGVMLARLQMQAWRGHYGACYPRRLREYYRELQGEVELLRQEALRLRQSPGWRFYRLIGEASQAGFDLLSQVVAELRQGMAPGMRNLAQARAAA